MKEVKIGDVEVLQLSEDYELWGVAIHDDVQWVQLSEGTDVCDAHELAGRLRAIIKEIKAG